MQRVAVVTGASGGIGYETAKLFSQKGFVTYGLSRTAPPLESVRFLPVDLTDGEAVRLAFARIGEETGRIDVLVNNAGFGIAGAAAFTGEQDAAAQFDVNFFAVHRCVKHALPLLRENGGKIVNISSAAAVFPIPFQAFYSASKAAVNAFSLALGNELRPLGVRVCAVMPGDVKTGFTAARRKCAGGEALYGEGVARSVAVMERDEENGMSPAAAAARIVKIACARGTRPLYAIGTRYKLFLFLDRVLPKRLICFAVGRLYMK